MAKKRWWKWRQEAKLNWNDIVDTAEESQPTTEADWLQSAVPQSIVNDAMPIAIPEPEPAPPAKPASPTPSVWPWLLSALTICSATGGLAFLWLAMLPPPTDCQNITRLSADAERLYCAQQAAQSGEVAQLATSLSEIGAWPATHPLYNEAQKAIETWSNLLIGDAKRAFNQGNIQRANEIIGYIPTNSPRYKEAQTAIADWRKQWQQGQYIYNVAQTALRNQKWDEASAQLSALAELDNPFWREKRLRDLSEQLVLERKAWQQVIAARQAVQADTPQNLGAAITLALEVDRDSYAWVRAKADVDRWTNRIVSIGWQQWKAGNRIAAAGAIEQIPKSIALNPTARDMLVFGQAQARVSEAQSEWKPALSQVVNLLEGITALHRIEPGSAFYGQSRQDLQNWKRQLEDVTRLQYANLAASLGQKSTLEMAIAQASQITPTRPRRQQAQTLTAHWQNQVERIEDRPFILRAQAMADPDSIPALKGAIAEASQVALGRSRRVEAQTLIADWTNQVERLEDQPILDEARSIANRGRYSQAIVVASRIQSGRVLYGEARSDIRRWRYQILLAQDRSILRQARALASVDSLTLAINKASQIPPGRPLYGQAQAEIAQWAIRRQEIWDMWAAESGSSYDDGYDESY
ncbi:hypothetical protein H6F67_08725 [Microcoleus sp. FACHB-1515]|uniref:hypothetical protein n=1 Tax=Cyanophyceae TaxID=3028117 RepID=UPI001688E308|nr:hypothetical protein [Microcoleus sp. FACHB-1515]MBD2089936.1 hypothetical protein [Microcoleus sp. FACHB-1515]